MFPGGFVDSSEEAKDFVLVAEVIEKMSKRAKKKNYNNAYPNE